MHISLRDFVEVVNWSIPDGFPWMAIGDFVIKWDHEKLGVVLSPEWLNLNS